MAEGTTKNAIWRRPESRRWRRDAATCAWSPSALDMAGSCAAETAMPNRLTGRAFSVCAVNSAATAPSPKRLAMMESM